MNDTSQWLTLDPTEFENDAEQTINGVLFHVSVSPYDMPQAIRGGYDEGTRRFVIEFKYLSREETRTQQVDDHVTLRLGERSHRLYAIEADVEAMGVDGVLLRMEKVIDNLTPSVADRSHPASNYAVAKRVINDKASELWRMSPRTQEMRAMGA